LPIDDTLDKYLCSVVRSEEFCDNCDESFMQLYYHTPLGSVILKLFDKLKESIKSQYPTLPAGYVKAYIFGGAAMHIYTNARSSHDVDTDWNASLKLDTDLVSS
jgi:hypothetical protein